MKFITLTLLALISVSCATNTMDRDVELEIRSSPVVQQEVIVMAFPVLIEASTLSDADKDRMESQYQRLVKFLINSKIEQNQVVSAILTNLQDKNYDPRKMAQMSKKYKQIENSMSKVKIDFISNFTKTIQGKVSPEDVARIMNELQKSFDKKRIDNTNEI